MRGAAGDERDPARPDAKVQRRGGVVSCRTAIRSTAVPRTLRDHTSEHRVDAGALVGQAGQDLDPAVGRGRSVTDWRPPSIRRATMATPYP